MDGGGSTQGSDEKNAEKSMDIYLNSIGLHRKKIAKDGSCLFRAVAEQVLHCQSLHTEVRAKCVAFLKENRETYEAFIEGDFEEYLCKLQDPQHWVGEVEMNALAVMYKRDFLIFQEPGRPAVNITDNSYKDKVRLCFLNGNHYDSVYPITYIKNAAICQSILYELLYDGVFKADRNTLDRLSQRASRPSDFLIDDHMAVCGSSDESDVDAGDALWMENGTNATTPRHNSQSYRGRGRGWVSERVRRSLNPTLYRNVEFDIWHKTKRAQQKLDYSIAAGMQYAVGDRCQVCLNGSGRCYSATIKEVAPNNGPVTVYVEELGRKQVPLWSLRPLREENSWTTVANRDKRLSNGHSGEWEERGGRGKGRGKPLPPSSSVSQVTAVGSGGRLQKQSSWPPQAAVEEQGGARANSRKSVGSADSALFGLTEQQRLAKEEEERNVALVELQLRDETSFPALGTQPAVPGDGGRRKGGEKRRPLKSVKPKSPSEDVRAPSPSAGERPKSSTPPLAPPAGAPAPRSSAAPTQTSPAPPATKPPMASSVNSDPGPARPSTHKSLSPKENVAAAAMATSTSSLPLRSVAAAAPCTSSAPTPKTSTLASSAANVPRAKGAVTAGASPLSLTSPAALLSLITPALPAAAPPPPSPPSTSSSPSSLPQTSSSPVALCSSAPTFIAPIAPSPVAAQGFPPPSSLPSSSPPINSLPQCPSPPSSSSLIRRSPPQAGVALSASAPPAAVPNAAAAMMGSCTFQTISQDSQSHTAMQVHIHTAPQTNMAPQTDTALQAPQAHTAPQTDTALQVHTVLQAPQAHTAPQAYTAPQTNMAPQTDTVLQAPQAHTAPQTDTALQAPQVHTAPQTDTALQVHTVLQAPQAHTAPQAYTAPQTNMAPQTDTALQAPQAHTHTRFPQQQNQTRLPQPQTEVPLSQKSVSHKQIQAHPSHNEIHMSQPQTSSLAPQTQIQALQPETERSLTEIQTCASNSQPLAPQLQTQVSVPQVHVQQVSQSHTEVTSVPQPELVQAQSCNQSPSQTSVSASVQPQVSHPVPEHHPAPSPHPSHLPHPSSLLSTSQSHLPPQNQDQSEALPPPTQGVSPDHPPSQQSHPPHPQFQPAHPHPHPTYHQSIPGAISLHQLYQDPLYPGFPQGEKGDVALIPPCSSSRAGEDLPQDVNILRFFFNLGVKAYSMPMFPPYIYLLPLQQAHTLHPKPPSRSPSPTHLYPPSTPPTRQQQPEVPVPPSQYPPSSGSAPPQYDHHAAPAEPTHPSEPTFSQTGYSVTHRMPCPLLPWQHQQQLPPPRNASYSSGYAASTTHYPTPPPSSQGYHQGQVPGPPLYPAGAPQYPASSLGYPSLAGPGELQVTQATMETLQHATSETLATLGSGHGKVPGPLEGYPAANVAHGNNRRTPAVPALPSLALAKKEQGESLTRAVLLVDPPLNNNPILTWVSDPEVKDVSMTTLSKSSSAPLLPAVYDVIAKSAGPSDGGHASRPYRGHRKSTNPSKAFVPVVTVEGGQVGFVPADSLSVGCGTEDSWNESDGFGSAQRGARKSSGRGGRGRGLFHRGRGLYRGRQGDTGAGFSFVQFNSTQRGRGRERGYSCQQ